MTDQDRDGDGIPDEPGPGLIPSGPPVGEASGSSGNASGTNKCVITTGTNGVMATSNPNKEKTETHHIVEQCQVKKSGFAQVDIQGNSNLISLPYDLHRKLSGFYSSKQPFSDGMRVRDWLAGQPYEYQYNFGMEKITEFWGELYGAQIDGTLP